MFSSALNKFHILNHLSKLSARMVTHEALIIWKNNNCIVAGQATREIRRNLLLMRERVQQGGLHRNTRSERRTLWRDEQRIKKTKQEKNEKAKQNEERASDLVSSTNNLVHLGCVRSSVVQMDQILSFLADPKEAVLSQLQFHKAAGSKATKPYYCQTEPKHGVNESVFP